MFIYNYLHLNKNDGIQLKLRVQTQYMNILSSIIDAQFM